VDFTLTEEQRDIQKAAREFIEGEHDKENILQWEIGHIFPKEVWRKACKLGLIGVHFPEEYGGQGYGITENVLIVEEFYRKDSSVGIALSLSDFSSEVVLRFGTDEQKKRYLTPVTKGEFISAGAYTEPNHGSDITMLSTTAVKHGGRLFCY
jgi:alkylation response protein AidB-like acyl-CoA dehydrogenase